MRLRRPKRQQRADPVRIAELEYELFGIQPAPGTTAAAVVGMRHLAATLRGERFPAVGGHASSDSTAADLPPLPAWAIEHRD